jgi:hypothetical protein
MKTLWMMYLSIKESIYGVGVESLKELRRVSRHKIASSRVTNNVGFILFHYITSESEQDSRLPEPQDLLIYYQVML